MAGCGAERGVREVSAGEEGRREGRVADAGMGDGRSRHQSAHISTPKGTFYRGGPREETLAVRERTGEAGPRNGGQDRGERRHEGRRLGVGPQLDTAEILEPNAPQAEEKESLDSNRGLKFTMTTLRRFQFHCYCLHFRLHLRLRR